MIRHGQTMSDVEDRYGGDYDDHLTELGKSQVKGLARRLKDKNIEIIFASNRIRAQETAKILNTVLKVKIKTEKGIRERNLYGPLTGMKKSEAKEKHPELVEALKDYRNTIEGAESYDDSRRRMIKAFKKVVDSKKEIVAIVTHSGPIKSIFRELLGKEIDTVADCASAELEALDGKAKLLRTEGIVFK